MRKGAYDMKKTKLFSYVDKGTIVHKLSGLTKLICFLLLSFASMFTYDLRVLFVLLAISVAISYIAKFPFRRYKIVLIYFVIFMIFNFLLNFLLAPNYGTEIFGTRHVIISFTDYFTLTLEQLYYQFAKLIKYICIMPLGLMFFYTIDPSEFASSLNGIKVPYKACTVFALALRYFPDIQRDYTNINLAQQARGIDTSKKASLTQRVKSIAKILLPLVFSTLDRVELISNAMELRGYGKAKSRTWYSYRPLQKRDYLAILFCTLVFMAVLFMRFVVVKNLFWNPFI